MFKFIIALVTSLFFSISANALDILNPWKASGLGVELHAMLSNFLKQENVEHRIVNLDNCRALPTEWKRYKSPIVINWSDNKECNMPVKNVTLISQGTQLFCSTKEVDLKSKTSWKLGWQATAPLNEVYNVFEKKYGKVTKVPYLTGGQQVQGAVAGEIDIAVIGQATALTSPLKCFLAVAPFRDIPVIEGVDPDMYLSLAGVLYEDSQLKPLIEKFVRTPEMVEWRNRRALVFRMVPDDRALYMSNTFNRK